MWEGHNIFSEGNSTGYSYFKGTSKQVLLSTGVVTAQYGTVPGGVRVLDIHYPFLRSLGKVVLLNKYETKKHTIDGHTEFIYDCQTVKYIDQTKLCVDMLL